ncbi:hypothetical protein [Fimbriimonas ginsengisoli]|uniref:Uncharacterized protein n=1 Tax=Fimbriimonas ginsengisoli Gsoil 348 TaxID=661478 RepID=A0A068NUQ4_FIMGI|nr:hypothetical protein [Fimbriimonas ginsengisoli]AIE87273.1 hypothetical protein OP10G_3905 [Fimbriimonas ginsengisoli Gsoil 348]
MTNRDNVYGENHPASDDRGNGGSDIRDEIAGNGVAEDIDKARERSERKTGGMGRRETPKDGVTQGSWQRPEEAELAAEIERPEDTLTQPEPSRQ